MATLNTDTTNAYGLAIRDQTEKTNGGYSHDAWVNNIVSERIQFGYIRLGQKLLRPYLSNTTQLDPNRKKYILCLTKNEQASRDLGITQDCVVAEGSWFGPLFSQPKPLKANLSKYAQQVAYLSALGYNNERIARRLKPRENPDLTQRDKDIAAIASCLQVIYKKLPVAYPNAYAMNKGLPPSDQMKMVILSNLHEIRSVIVPLYPDL